MSSLRRLLWVFAISASLARMAAAGPTAVRAEVSEPVVEELMGGCSLKCAFPWQVEVLLPGAAKASPVKMLNDSSAQTAWIAPAAGAGVGTRFRFLMPKRLPKEMEGQVPLYGLDVINGNWRDEDGWKNWGRLRKVRLLYNEKTLCEVTFADSRRWEKVSFTDVFVRGGDVLTMEVLEIYPGTKAGLAVSEVVLQGAH